MKDKTIYFYDTRSGRYEKYHIECEYLDIDIFFENFEDAINYAITLSNFQSLKIQFYF